MIVVPFSAGQSMSPTSIRAVYCRRLAILRASLEASEAAIRALLWRIAGRIPRFSREVRGRSGRFSGEPSPNYASNFNVLAAVLQSIDSLQQDADTQRRPEAAKDTQKAGSARACALLQPAAWGVKPKARPGRSGRPNLLYERWGNRRRLSRRSGAAAANERATAPTGARAAVRGTVPRGAAVVPQGVHRVVRGGRRSRRCAYAQSSAWGNVQASMQRCPMGCIGVRHGPHRRVRRGPCRSCRLRRRCAGPGCRAALPCRRGSR